ncbi:DJ-1/PfpI family protein [Actinotalea sp. M2MS4P-6]|uniref:DJ-1/PfpI family protein n=1 Tax=Actinotalea sp. M2MS4P-6 TaxID=2983762 RepID=UPI0021E50F3C|nr:DJ-1/PfpI family protein [Actinotalea sp. M2MS4P-6]MCV2395502.1 DJ-1/PfpI family protein [Actinotalea sp. M2MS4P-6]
MLEGRVVGFLTDVTGVEDAELAVPWQAVLAAGGRPVLVAPRAGRVLTVLDGAAPAGAYPVDRTLAQVCPDDLAMLVLPGGTLSCDALRMDPAAVALVRGMAEAGKPIAAASHAPWLLIEADVVEGKELTSFPSLATDIRNAGAIWVDEPTVVSERRYPLLTMRRADDLPAFTEALPRLAA